MLAKVVNDNAGFLVQRDALRFFASKLAPTEGRGDIQERVLEGRDVVRRQRERDVVLFGGKCQALSGHKK